MTFLHLLHYLVLFAFIGFFLFFSYQGARASASSSYYDEMELKK